VTLVTWKLVSIHLEIVVALVQERCTVFAKRTIGTEIILAHPMVLLGDEAEVDAHFSLFGDSAKLNAR
jgi:hypothetical protein